MRLLVLAAIVSPGCALEAPAPTPLPVGDLARFAAEVQPVLERRCATPCHADPDRPLALFSPGVRRADPTWVHRLEPLTAEELAANAQAIAAFALEPLLAGAPMTTCPVACKPLATGAGGCGHVVGAVFAGADDRDYQTLLGYLDALALPEAP